ncbi:hypothetical protein F5144DRAFT_498910 [Chaetomium tenue]|uniref:Uncharacterized protein n=1 Tax=Chaetomium tenue TaxID=1854479 RepID=A0ACB7NVS8_9PEZI|nr:hypothetical protein F5144DRAFT_498910 [Chaetomium globosum]
MGRPGAMLVQSQPTPGGITEDNLAEWYFNKHIPEVLSTGGVRGVLFCHVDRQSSEHYVGEPGPKQFLAAYLLPDLDWLHEEDCGLWKLPLVLASDDSALEEKHRGRSVFEVAEFTTHFWEVVNSTTHNGMATQLTVTTLNNVKAADEPPKRLVLSYLDNPPSDHSLAETRLKFAGPNLISALGLRQKQAEVTSTLFKVDETRPGPPGSKSKEGDVPAALPGKRYLHFRQLSGHGPCDIPFFQPDLQPDLCSSTVEYMVMAEYGDTTAFTVQR